MVTPLPSPERPPRYGDETRRGPHEAESRSGRDTSWHLEEPQAISPAIHPLLGRRIVVGRSSSADLVLHHLDVSRRHLRLTRSGAAYHVTDLDSRFGTAVNGRTLTPDRAHTLADGDLLRIGRRIFTVRKSSPLVTAAAIELADLGSRLRLLPMTPENQAGRPIRLDGLGPWVVGRHTVDAAIPLADPSVSRHHAVFVRRGHTVWVRDLSQVGTTAGGTRLEPGELMRLVDGDVVGFQGVKFRVEIGEPPA